MKKIFTYKLILISITLLSLNIISYADDDCGEPDGSSIVEGCLKAKRLEQMNKEYKEIYHFHISHLHKEIDKKNFIDAESTWESYRVKRCDFEDRYLGGANSISWVRCQIKLTDEHLAYLKGFYH